MEETSLFAENLTRLMKENKYSRKDLAKELDIPYTTLTNWIKGVRHPKMEMVEILANFFEVPFTTLLDKHDEEKEQLVFIYEKLNAKNQKKLCDSAMEIYNHQVQEEAKVLPLKKKVIPTIPFDYYGAVSAGRGLFLQEEYRETVEIPEDEVVESADFVLSINGDSMEPEYSDGEYVFVKKQDTLFNGALGIFVLNGEAFFKRIWFEKNHAVLESINEKYKDIIVTEEDQFTIIGKVLN